MSARGPIPDKAADRPTVPQVMELIAGLSDPDFGPLHIVLSDGNLADGHLESCRDRAREEGDRTSEMIAEKMLAMTGTQRRRIYRGWRSWV